MKLVVQRVKNAKVRVIDAGRVVGKIGMGLFILVGVGKDDNKEDAENLAEKISKLRIISDVYGKMNLSVKETNREILVVSQFTLLADTSGGNRPSFIKVAKPNKARDIYEFFVTSLKKLGLHVETGSFGEYMEIEAILDGPVTIVYS